MEAGGGREEPVRLAYVGAGSLAQRVHLPNFTSLPGCRVVALAEVRRALGEAVRERFAIPRLYPDHRALLEDPQFEAVAVSAPFALQGEIARECLLAGKSVFMEKPMAVSVKQAGAILEASRRGGGRLMVGYMKRFDAGNELAHDLIAGWRRSGEAGRLLYVRAHGFGGDWVAGLDVPVLTSDEPPPPAPTEDHLPDWLPPERGRTYVSFLQQYTHNVNLLRYFLDAGDRAGVVSADLDDGDGYTGVTVLRVDGVRCTLETGSLRYHRWDEHTQAYFQEGWVHTWAPPLLLRNAVAEVEVYRASGGDAEPIASSAGTEGPGDSGRAAGAVRHTVSRP
ncbi:MAG TPA: Gfo/Idh/MocA family oxidoreductase, partial [Chloroflexota bacterium]|nr:Gfo/Idh/MocA family oxidoreductase [Chloroflexota bacterium]